MKTYKMKRVVVGILLVILTLGFCVVGTGAAHADQMGGPMSQQRGFGPGGRQGSPGTQMGGPGGQSSPMDQQGFGSGSNYGSGAQSFGPGGNYGSNTQDSGSFVPYDESPDAFVPYDDMSQQQGFGPGGNYGSDAQSFGPGGNYGSNTQDSDSFVPYDESPDAFVPYDDSSDGFGPRGGFGRDMGADFDGQFSRDGAFGPGGQHDFGGHGGLGRDGAPEGMDNGVREAIAALEDGETKTNLETLMQNVHTAMDALHDADDDSREAAETGVKEARDALNTALEAAGIDASMNEPPEKPDDGNDAARPERPENSGRQSSPDFMSREAIESIDLEDEEQVQNLFRQFLTWLQSSKT